MFIIYTVNEISNKINKSESTIRDYLSRNKEKFKGHITKRTVLLIDDIGFNLLNEHYAQSTPMNLDDNSLQKQLEEKEIEIEELKVKLKARDVQNITLEGTVFGMKKCAEEIVKENNCLKEKLKKFNNFERVVEDTCKKSATLLHQAGEETDNLREENYHLKLLLELILSN